MAAEQQLLTDALTLMGLGLSTVFVFLTLLVGVTSLMSTVVNRIAPVRVVSGPVVAEVSPAADDQTLLAVITAAIHAHRTRH